MSVQQIIDDARGYAKTVQGQADVALKAAASAINGLGFSVIGYTPTAITDPKDTTVPEVPTLDRVELQLDNPSAMAPVFQDIPAIQTEAAPQDETLAPELTLPTVPSSLTEFAGVIPAVRTEFALPEAPVLTIPDAPAISDHQIPTAPALVLPEITAEKPRFEDKIPTDLIQTFEAQMKQRNDALTQDFSSKWEEWRKDFYPDEDKHMGNIAEQLDRYFAQKGSGLEPMVEARIHNAALHRTGAEVRRARDSAFEEAASRGFTLPSGTILSAIQQARQGAVDVAGKSASDIAIAAAELEQKNIQFALTTVIALRENNLKTAFAFAQLWVSINQQALEYANTVKRLTIEAYEVAAKAFSQKLEAYKTEVQVYELHLRAAMTSIEIYNAEIKILETQTNVDRTKLDVYRARIDVLNAAQALYRSRVAAVVETAGLEKLKIDLFQSQVQAYQASVQAKSAEWQGYSAAIQGETAKTQMYSAQISAYNSRVTAYRAKVEAMSEVVRAAATTNQARSSQYVAQLEGYKAMVSAKGAMASTKLENQRQQLVSYQAQVTAAAAQYQGQIEKYKALTVANTENAKVALNAIAMSIDSQRERGKAIAEIALQTGHVYGNLAAAATSGVVSLASASE